MLLDPIQSGLTDLKNRVNGLTDKNFDDKSELVGKISELDGKVDVILQKLNQSTVQITNQVEGGKGGDAAIKDIDMNQGN